MEDDGNCQFRALSQELFGTQRWHGEVRKHATAYMRKRPHDFSIYFEGESAWQKYVRDMAVNGTWGDELTLRAVADALRVKIHVLTSDEENWYLQYEPAAHSHVRELFLAYISPIHYNTLAPIR